MFTLVIAGRPNVGKSTFFNRLAGKKLAIVHNTPGVTRDWREAEADLYGHQFRVIDTAGLEEALDGSIEGRMRKQTEYALEQADAILFMIDGRSGLTPVDEHFARFLRKQKKPVILAVNKCESEKVAQDATAEAWGLGLGTPVPISAEHGHGLDLVLEALEPHMPEGEDDQDDDRGDADAIPENLDDLEGDESFALAEDTAEELAKPIKVAIAGRPNVGKSTLMNTLLGDERSMTGPEAGITRDTVAAKWEYEGRSFRLVDTAGLRRKAKIHEDIEQMSASESIRAIRLSQIVILMFDATERISKQDLQIASHVISEGRAIVMVANKWDVVKDRKETLKQIEFDLERSLAQIKDIPVVMMSALTGKNTDGLMQEVLRVFELWNSRVPTGPLNRWLSSMESHHPAPLVQGKSNRLKFMAQIKSKPPTFAIWVSRPDSLPDSYQRYLINGVRERFDLPSVPIRLIVRKSKNPYV